MKTLAVVHPNRIIFYQGNNDFHSSWEYLGQVEGSIYKMWDYDGKINFSVGVFVFWVDLIQKGD